MGENHILKDNQWFVYDDQVAEAPKWQRIKMLKPAAGLPMIDDDNGDETILLNGKLSSMLAPLWRFQPTVQLLMPCLLFIDCTKSCCLILIPSFNFSRNILCKTYSIVNRISCRLVAPCLSYMLLYQYIFNTITEFVEPKSMNFLHNAQEVNITKPNTQIF